MAPQINDKELQSIFRLPPDQRYAYFVKRVADWEEIWSLRGEGGWVLAGDENMRELVPVWPFREYASECAVATWAGNVPESISLDSWLEEWTLGMTEDHRLVAVFPNQENNGVVVEPIRLKADIEIELLKY